MGTPGRLDLLVEPGHVLCDLQDSFAQGLWCKHLDLVAVAEYPPGYFAQAVNAELNNSRTVTVAGDFLCAVSLYFGNIMSYFGQEPQLDIVDSAFRYH